MAFDYRNLLWAERRQAKRMWSQLAALEAIAAGKEVTLVSPTEQDATEFMVEMQKLKRLIEGDDATP